MLSAAVVVVEKKPAYDLTARFKDSTRKFQAKAAANTSCVSKKKKAETLHINTVALAAFNSTLDGCTRQVFGAVTVPSNYE
jgi:hypothetical protein